jgi:hypothetical protein
MQKMAQKNFQIAATHSFLVETRHNSDIPRAQLMEMPNIRVVTRPDLE